MAKGSQQSLKSRRKEVKAGWNHVGVDVVDTFILDVDREIYIKIFLNAHKISRLEIKCRPLK